LFQLVPGLEELAWLPALALQEALDKRRDEGQRRAQKDHRHGDVELLVELAQL
jgi:hypothetical protein